MIDIWSFWGRSLLLFLYVFSRVVTIAFAGLGALYLIEDGYWGLAVPAVPTIISFAFFSAAHARNMYNDLERAVVAEESGLGKTTFINTRSTTIKNYTDHKRRHQKQIDHTVEIGMTKTELEEKFFKYCS